MKKTCFLLFSSRDGIADLLLFCLVLFEQRWRREEEENISHREGVCLQATLLILLPYNTRRRFLLNCAPLRDKQAFVACRHSTARLKSVSTRTSC